MSNGNGGLVRALGVVEATAIVAGTVIGTSIFLKRRAIAAVLDSPGAPAYLLARCRTR